MQDFKQWYRSRTILASLVSIAAAAAGMAGVPITPADGSALAEFLVEAIIAISGILAILGRLRARHRIGGG